MEVPSSGWSSGLLSLNRQYVDQMAPRSPGAPSPPGAAMSTVGPKFE